MYAMLLTASLVVAEPPARNDAMTSLDGNWTILCLEKDGQPQPDAKDMTVMAKGDTITCSGKDGKPAMTWKVSFGPNATVKVTETTADKTESARANDPARAETKDDKANVPTSGVYVLTKDYLAICLHDGSTGTTNRDGANRDANDRPASGQTKSKCTIILKREATR